MSLVWPPVLFPGGEIEVTAHVDAAGCPAAVEMEVRNDVAEPGEVITCVLDGTALDALIDRLRRARAAGTPEIVVHVAAPKPDIRIVPIVVHDPRRPWLR